MPAPLASEPWKGPPTIPGVSFELAADLLGTCRLQLRPLGWSLLQTKPLDRAQILAHFSQDSPNPLQPR